ncbi:hypothetical protein [Bdellovibrio sp. HCB209]|uniref:hypothetical protein n=1 Tax=Bdellovibrio sp. HCB209 TaxID=3394354 RepID=UPI0039B3AECA
MSKILCFIFTCTSLFTLSAQAIELNILQPNYACQSKEFIPDDNLSVIVLQDKVSGLNHIEIAQSWFGGVRKAYFAVVERIEKNGDSQPIIFEGHGIQLTMDRTLKNDKHPFEAVLRIPVSQGEITTKLLLCESLHEQTPGTLQ